MIALNDSNVEAFLRESKYSVIYVWASWCQPCRQVSPLVEELFGEYENVKFGKVEADAHSEDFLSKHNVGSVPTVLFFHNGESLGSLVGAKPKHLYKVMLNTLIDEIVA